MAAPLKAGLQTIVIKHRGLQQLRSQLHQKCDYRSYNVKRELSYYSSPIHLSRKGRYSACSFTWAIIRTLKSDSCQNPADHPGIFHRLCSKSANPIHVLGIETSCDDTGIAVVDSLGNVIGDAIHSQTGTHIQMGGIIPPIARDLHAQNIDKVMKQCLEEANMTVNDMDAVAVTVKPGLAMSLNVGLEYAKVLVKKYRKPLIPIHHMEAHALTTRLMEQVEFPFLVLLISGGHSLLAVARNVDDFLLIGKSLDIAPGDAFDKVARELKLKNLHGLEQVSGGRAIEQLAKDGDPRAFPIVQPLIRMANCNFSFSGIKTSYHRLIINEERQKGIQGGQVLPNLSDICASFQYAVLNHLAKRVQRALAFSIVKDYLPTEKGTLVVSGGVASNQFIRTGLEKVCEYYDYRMVCPPPHLCTDNGIMIAWNGMEKLLQGRNVYSDPAEVEIQPKCPLGTDLTEEVSTCHLKLARIKLI